MCGSVAGAGAVRETPHVGPTSAAFVTLDKTSWVSGSLISLSTVT